MDRSAYKMGSYGAGALWCLKEREGKYITFNNLGLDLNVVSQSISAVTGAVIRVILWITGHA
jgi:hypothetical protein